MHAAVRNAIDLDAAFDIDSHIACDIYSPANARDAWENSGMQVTLFRQMLGPHLSLIGPVGVESIFS